METTTTTTEAIGRVHFVNDARIGKDQDAVEDGEADADAADDVRLGISRNDVRQRGVIGLFL